MIEIERKFLVDAPPDGVDLGEGEPLRQGYLAEEGDVAVRIRVAPSGARLTVKAGTGVSRTEVELPVTPEQADALWRHTTGRRIVKVRHRIPLDASAGLVAELDEYGDALAGLLTVEVEFASEEAAATFVPPAWFGREVTADGAWTNAALARSGRPSV